MRKYTLLILLLSVSLSVFTISANAQTGDVRTTEDGLSKLVNNIEFIDRMSRMSNQELLDMNLQMMVDKYVPEYRDFKMQLENVDLSKIKYNGQSAYSTEIIANGLGALLDMNPTEISNLNTLLSGNFTQITNAGNINLPKPTSLSTGDQVSWELLAFTNQLASYSDDPDTKKAMTAVNNIYTGANVVKDAFQGNGSAGELNASALALANSFAEFSDNPNVQKNVKMLNDIHSGFSQIKSEFGGSMDATTNQAMDILEAGIMVAGLIDAMLTPKPPTKGQIAARDYAKFGNKTILKVYKEFSTLPEQKGYDLMSLKNIIDFENKLREYDRATAMQRLLILKYLNYKDIPELDVMNTWMKGIQNDFNSKGLAYIKAEVDKLVNSDTPYHLRNSEQSLKSVRAEALLFKAQYYYKNGDEAQATLITKQIAEAAPHEELRDGINQAFEQRNYKMAGQLYPTFFAQWYEVINKITYDEEYQRILKKNSIASAEVNKVFEADLPVIGKGIVSLVKTGQHTNASAHLAQVYTLYNDYILLPKKKPKYYEPNYFTSREIEKIYFNQAEAEILQNQGKFTEALAKIDSAIYHAETKTTMFASSDGFYKFRLFETRIDILISQKNYEKALSECASVQRNASAFSSYAGSNYDASNMKFMQALIFYNMGKYQPALNTLTALRSINENMPKAYILEREIYLAMNDLESAQKVTARLNQLYNKK